jgi:hypothetical protein
VRWRVNYREKRADGFFLTAFSVRTSAMSLCSRSSVVSVYSQMMSEVERERDATKESSSCFVLLESVGEVEST